jgi:Tol biopolymer transport system component
LFVRESTLMAQQFDPKRLELGGDPFPIAEDVGNLADNSAAGFTVSDNGTLVYRTSGSSGKSYLMWFDRNGKETEAVKLPAAYANPALSPNLQRIAVAKTDAGVSDIWILDLERGTSTRFTVDPGDDNVPLWSPDGSTIVFGSNRGGGVYDLYEKPSSGVVQDEALLKSDHNKFPEDWSADGRLLLYRDVDPQTRGDLWVLPMTGGKKPEPVVRTPFGEIQGRFSPDGRRIAYVSNESGRNEVYVQGFPKAVSRTQISTAGGTRPRWRGDGKEIFFTSLVQEMMAVDMSVSSDGSLKAGLPHKLFTVIPGGVWDVTPDGQRFLINSRAQTSQATVTPLTVVVNWDRRSAPGK